MLTPPSDAKMTLAPVARPLPPLAPGAGQPGNSDFEPVIQFAALPPSIGRRPTGRPPREGSAVRRTGGLVLAFLLLVTVAVGLFHFRDTLKRSFAQASPTTQPAPAAAPDPLPVPKLPAGAGKSGATGTPAPSITVIPAPGTVRAPAPAPSRPAPRPAAKAFGDPVRPILSRATRSVEEARATGEGANARTKAAALARVDLSAIKTAAELAHKIAALDASVRASRALTAAEDAAADKLRRDLAVPSIPAVRRDNEMERWAGEVKLDEGRLVSDAAEKLLTARRQQLKLLQQEWGEWKYDAKAGKPRFDDPKTSARYDRLLADTVAAYKQWTEAAAHYKPPAPRG